jgi:hypothetical protein
MAVVVTKSAPQGEATQGQSSKNEIVNTKNNIFVSSSTFRKINCLYQHLKKVSSSD